MSERISVEQINYYIWSFICEAKTKAIPFSAPYFKISDALFE